MIVFDVLVDASIYIPLIMEWWKWNLLDDYGMVEMELDTVYNRNITTLQ